METELILRRWSARDQPAFAIRSYADATGSWDNVMKAVPKDKGPMRRLEVVNKEPIKGRSARLERVCDWTTGWPIRTSGYESLIFFLYTVRRNSLRLKCIFGLSIRSVNEVGTRRWSSLSIASVAWQATWRVSSVTGLLGWWSEYLDKAIGAEEAWLFQPKYRLE